jgi:hypothetical protein
MVADYRYLTIMLPKAVCRAAALSKALDYAMRVASKPSSGAFPEHLAARVLSAITTKTT